MQPAVEQIETAAEKLESKDLLDLLMRLARAYNRRTENDAEDEEIAHAWRQEAARRAEEMRSGRHKGVSLEEALEELRAVIE